jgi:hypothetical protein
MVSYELLYEYMSLCAPLKAQSAIQANLGYYVASELRLVTPGLLRGKIRQSGCL